MSQEKLEWWKQFDRMSDSTELDLVRQYCTCGNPDPLREDHTADCGFERLRRAAKKRLDAERGEP